MQLTRWAILIIIFVAGLSLDAGAQTGKDPVIIIPGLEGTEILQKAASPA